MVARREISPTLVRQLLKDLTDQDDLFVWRAQEAFNVFEEEELDQLVDSLIQLLKDEDRDVIFRAARKLSEIGQDHSVQYYDAVEPLIELLKDEHKRVRFMAHYALGNHDGDRGFKEAIKLLKHEDNGMIISAVESLERYLDDEAVEHLSELLENADENIRDKAANAIKTIQKQRF